MTRSKRFGLLLALVAALAIPAFAAPGTADFTRFFVIGDSYGAGFESNSLNETHQVYSWPATIAKQAGLKLCTATASATDPCFAQPLIAFPGISNELILKDIITYPPVIAPAPGSGVPLMTTFGRPYNNLAVPGATVGDTTTLTGAEPGATMTKIILRGLGTQVDQALSQKPTFVAIWIGGNDMLGAVSNGSPKYLTSVENFIARYNAMLDKITAGAPSAGIVVGTLPENPAALPFLTTVKPTLTVSGQTITLIADLGDGTVGPIPAGSFVTLPASSYIATGWGLPPQLKPLLDPAKYPDAGKPLPDALVLTPAEISVIQQRAIDFNSAILTAAKARNIPVADIRGLFDRVATRREFVGPFSFTGDYITGGFFGLDGVHLSDIGYMLFANEYIKAIDAGYDKEIPVASLTQFFANNGAMFPKSSSGMFFVADSPWEMSAEASQALQRMFTFESVASTDPVVPPSRGRGARH